MAFDPNQPYGIVSGDMDRAYYHQDGKYYDRLGVEVTSPGPAPLTPEQIELSKQLDILGVVKSEKTLTGGITKISAGVRNALAERGVVENPQAQLSQWFANALSDNSTEPGGPFYDAFGRVMRLPDGRIAHYFRRSTSHVGSAGDVYVQYLDADSAGWSVPSLFFTVGDGVSDSRFIGGCVTKSGAVVLLIGDYINNQNINRMRVMRSIDSGVTWVASQIYTDPVLAGTVKIYGPAVQGAGGVIMQPYYEEATNVVKAFKSTDDGVTWSVGPTIIAASATTATECAIAFLGGQQWIAVTRTSEATAAPFIACRSTDNGATWNQLGNISLETGQIVSPLLVTWISSSGVPMVSLYYADRTASRVKVRHASVEYALGGLILSAAWRPYQEINSYALGYPSVVPADQSSGSQLIVSYRETTADVSNTCTSMLFCGDEPAYDSGYFAVAPAQTYSKGLYTGMAGTGLPSRTRLTWSASNAYNGVVEYDVIPTSNSGARVTLNGGNKTATVMTGSTYTFDGTGFGTAPVQQTGGYYRLRCWQ